MKTASALVYSLVSIVSADVRLNFEQKGLQLESGAYGIPSTFGYAALQQQKENNNDQFLRSNIDNEANQRNTANELAQDMLPCRQDAVGQVMQFQKNAFYEIPLKWNNPHDSDCEVNIFSNGMSTVTPVKAPFNCGGGYKDQLHSFKIPDDFQGCTSANDSCRLQIYGHSVEPRTYAMCIDFVISPTAPPGLPSALTHPDKDIPKAVPQAAVHFSDSFDTSHIDSQYSGYRGQQPNAIRPQLRAAIEIQSYLGNGGLVPLGNIDKQKAAQMRNQVQNKIKTAEKAATAKNKAAQLQRNQAAKAAGAAPTCFEGEIYGVVNNPDCTRLFTNTYVTNVDYQAIANEFIPKFKAAGLFAYSPTLKNVAGVTPPDPYGSFKVNGKPSLTPANAKNKNANAKANGNGNGNGAAPLAPPPRGVGFTPVKVTGPVQPVAPLFPPLAADFKTGPPKQGGAGAGGDPGQGVPDAGTTGKRLANFVPQAPVAAPKVDAGSPVTGPEPVNNPDDEIGLKNIGELPTDIPAPASTPAPPTGQTIPASNPTTNPTGVQKCLPRVA